MSKWDEPATDEELIVGLFVVAFFAMLAVPAAFVISALAGLVGLGGTQNMWTILVSFGIVTVVGTICVAIAMSKVHK